jgi:hypothetical protein
MRDLSQSKKNKLYNKIKLPQLIHKPSQADYLCLYKHHLNYALLQTSDQEAIPENIQRQLNSIIFTEGRDKLSRIYYQNQNR